MVDIVVRPERRSELDAGFFVSSSRGLLLVGTEAALVMFSFGDGAFVAVVGSEDAGRGFKVAADEETTNDPDDGCAEEGRYSIDATDATRIGKQRNDGFHSCTNTPIYILPCASMYGSAVDRFFVHQ